MSKLLHGASIQKASEEIFIIGLVRSGELPAPGVIWTLLSSTIGRERPEAPPFRLSRCSAVNRKRSEIEG